MKEYIKRTIDGMRQELLEFLPQRIIDVIEPKDVLRMHQYKIGNEIIKEQYRIKSTQEYIELMNWYDAKSRIVLK
tara:strand:- start:253 stop:477 length:225 start_codon:yes stop_codon:yes gene_type:complete